jgi:hypothetical protein
MAAGTWVEKSLESSEGLGKKYIIESSFRERPQSNSIALKRSFNAMDILCAETPLIKRYIEDKFDAIGTYTTSPADK